MKGQLKKIEIGIKVENVDQGGIGVDRHLLGHIKLGVRQSHRLENLLPNKIVNRNMQMIKMSQLQKLKILLHMLIQIKMVIPQSEYQL